MSVMAHLDTTLHCSWVLSMGILALFEIVHQTLRMLRWKIVYNRAHDNQNVIGAVRRPRHNSGGTKGLCRALIPIGLLQIYL